MRELKPKHWVFTIPEDNPSSYILYAPLHHLTARISDQAREILVQLLDGQEVFGEESEQMKDFLTDEGLMTLPKDWQSGSMPGNSLEPNSFSPNLTKHQIILSLTNKCNLRCVYCYAETGADFTTMKWDVAKDAIDSLISETLSFGNKEFSILFHGGGEAFVEYILLQQCVEYAKERAEVEGLKASFSAVTNATLITPERAQWLKDSGFTHFTISLDGVKEVHNRQRPHFKGIESFDKVMSGIRAIKDAGVHFSIRSTVTDIGVNRMTEFVRFVAAEVFSQSSGSIHFEPMSLCGRAAHSQSDQLSTDPYSFIRNYMAAKQVGEELGVKILCTLDTFKREKKQYCGANNCTMVCVTPEGRLSSCSRVTKQSDVGSELFLYGNHSPETHNFNINEDQRSKVREHGELPLKCTECFARWNCQGDCPISRYAYPEHHKMSCRITRQLLMESLKVELEVASKPVRNK